MGYKGLGARHGSRREGPACGVGQKMTQVIRWREMVHLLGLDVPTWKTHALDYCESAGMRFCVDFGVDNAIEHARTHWRHRPRLRS